MGESKLLLQVLMGEANVLIGDNRHLGKKIRAPKGSYSVIPNSRTNGWL